MRNVFLLVTVFICVVIYCRMRQTQRESTEKRDHKEDI